MAFKRSAVRSRLSPPTKNLETVLVSRFSFFARMGAAAFGLPLPPVQLSLCISRRRREMMRFSRREMYDWEMPMRSATSFWVSSFRPPRPNRREMMSFSRGTAFS